MDGTGVILKQRQLGLKLRQKSGSRKGAVKLVLYLILLIHLVFTGYPFVWMVISAFKSDKEYFANPWGLPTEWHFENFAKAWNQGISSYLFNSLYITLFSVLGLLVVSTLIGYYLAARPFRGSGLLLGMFFLGMLIPVHSTLIPLFIMANAAGAYDTFWSLFFPYIGFNLPVAVFLSHAFFKDVPKEIEEAAVVDGCSIYQSFFRIYFPLAKPVLATVTIVSFFSIMNDFVFPLVMVSKEALKTLPIGLMMFKGNFSASYSLISAALVITTTPIIVMYMFLQKYVHKGVVAGAVKG
ncbi:carbohydrate ABC transporter permease [Paenibacillus sp. MMS20-IR301]|uniref:carbohydrate ABC transporter permease n=1 Tax=Paenibacillus sp. MMS20-IR301 TaxID=2895946 RepID=UPI0028EEE44B|nr:carbohydrate ABC transporter permease [Paenibacillus sp. MMS20-IR301]WNS41915.1 carbohydrate ABC transporter permease [Paenibacillus sp. MMS20-IR301]